jgi:hypothetical protein
VPVSPAPPALAAPRGPQELAESEHPVAQAQAGPVDLQDRARLGLPETDPLAVAAPAVQVDQTAPVARIVIGTADVTRTSSTASMSASARRKSASWMKTVIISWAS